MSQNNSFTSGDFLYTPTNKETNLHNFNVPQSNCHQSVLVEIRDDMKSLKKEMTELKDGIKRMFTKLTEEVIAVKLENRKHQDGNINDEHKGLEKLPFSAMQDLQTYEEEVTQDEDKLKHFKKFIAKTGGEGPTQFLRAAVRKVFSDELASCYSWKGTSTKPSAEKCFLITSIKNICHQKFKCTDKEMNSVFQKHFVHAKDRVAKRKRTN